MKRFHRHLHIVLALTFATQALIASGVPRVLTRETPISAGATDAIWNASQDSPARSLDRGATIGTDSGGSSSPLANDLEGPKACHWGNKHQINPSLTKTPTQSQVSHGAVALASEPSIGSETPDIGNIKTRQTIVEHDTTRHTQPTSILFLHASHE